VTEQIQEPVSAGRPRDPRLDRSILAATRDLLGEVGYTKTTISAIARRSGVATPAIYRRWSSKEEIVEEAVFGVQDATTPPATDDLLADLNTWARMFLAQLADPPVRAALPGLISSYQHSRINAYDDLLARSENPIRLAFVDRIVAEAPDAPEAATAAGNEMFDILVATTIVRGLTRGHQDADAFCDSTADTLAFLVRARLAQQREAVGTHTPESPRYSPNVTTSGA